MSIATDLDTWAAGLATSLGYQVTRDPKQIFPPCVYIGFPDAAVLTVGEAFALDIPLWIVAPGEGKQAGDQLLDMVEDFLTTVEPLGRQLSAEPLALDGVEYHSMRATVRVHVTPTPVVLPDPPTTP